MKLGRTVRAWLIGIAVAVAVVVAVGAAELRPKGAEPTPLHLDLTHFGALGRMAEWETSLNSLMKRRSQ